MLSLLNRAIFGLSVIGTVLGGQVVSAPRNALTFSCPGVSSSGTRPHLGLEPIPEVTTKEEDAMEAPQELIDRALPIVGFFESSSVDPFTNISSTDTISLGYMQWNWGTKSLINTFMATVRPTDIALADGKIQPVLTTLKMFADKPATISEISGQQAAAQLLANRALVQTWLATEQLRLRQ